jgi:hypothetical protein
MKRTVIALVAVAALFALVSPAMALGPGACSVLQQVSEMIGGAIDGVVANNCATSAPAPPGGGGNATVATSEPLAALGVGLGLLGARLLRRR